MILRSLAVITVALGLAAGLLACAGPGVLNAITDKSGYAVVRDIRYSPGDRGIYDLYVPDDAGATTPVVVFFYGGSWDSGSKDIYLFLGQSLASEGFVVAIPDYRVYPEVTFPGFVEDGAKAVAAIETAVRKGTASLPAGKHPVFLMGHSAGAQIAALLALDRHYLKAAGAKAPIAGFVGLAGPYDFLPLDEGRYKRIFPEALRPASQPVNFARAGAPPMLLVAGSADTTVKPANTVSLAEKMKAVGGRARADIVPGVDHIGAISAMATAISLGDRTIRATVLDFLKDPK